MNEWLRALSAFAWIICLVSLWPAVWRLLRVRGRYLDPIWAIVFLLAVNRISFLSRAPYEVSHLTAIALALTMATVSVGYQRHDR